MCSNPKPLASIHSWHTGDNDQAAPHNILANFAIVIAQHTVSGQTVSQTQFLGSVQPFEALFSMKLNDLLPKWHFVGEIPPLISLCQKTKKKKYISVLVIQYE